MYIYIYSCHTLTVFRNRNRLITITTTITHPAHFHSYYTPTNMSHCPPTSPSLLSSISFLLNKSCNHAPHKPTTLLIHVSLTTSPPFPVRPAIHSAPVNARPAHHFRACGASRPESEPHPAAHHSRHTRHAARAHRSPPLVPHAPTHPGLGRTLGGTIPPQL